MKQIINTTKAPAPIGPYNQAVRVQNMLYVSGQIAIDPASGDIVQGDIRKETQRVLLNIKEILNAAGMNLNHVVKTTIFLIDMNNFNAVNEEYGIFFTTDYPARETVQVSRLPKDANVEISVIASLT